jgi:hypothetical protein
VPELVDDSERHDLTPLDSIVTIPTRGLFAEAQMGHCNSCEKRDVGRSSDWSEMTVEEPPAITGIEPGPRGQMPQLTPAQLPSNVIQIQQPPSAPDPTGLAAALGVLGAPNIFRDLSGLDEASALLGKLTDGTTRTLEEMIKTAGQAKTKVDAERTKAASGSDGTSKKQTPTERYDNLQVAKEVENAAADLGWDEETTERVTTTILGAGATNGSGGSTTTSGAPVSSAAGLQGILDELMAFGARTGSGAWPHLDRKQVASDIRRLAISPDTLRQGALGLCGPAAFVNAWTRAAPVEFARFAMELFENGAGDIWRMHIEPDSDLLEQDYSAITPDSGLSMPSEGDWMVLSALRDWANVFFDYEGTPQEGFEGGTYVQEIITWLMDCGVYVDVHDETGFVFEPMGFDDAVKLDPGPLRDVIIVVNADMLNPNKPIPTVSVLNHVMQLRSKVKRTNDLVEFTYWSWGKVTPVTVANNFTVERFDKLYSGAIVAERLGASP